MSSEKKRSKTSNNTPLSMYDTDSPQDMGSFQALQSLGKALFESCTEVQRLMNVNRQNRTIAKKELANNCNRLTEDAHQNGQKVSTEMSSLLLLRKQITDLENEHIVLHKEFIALQSRCRQMVREQRNSLVGTINRTRALSSDSANGTPTVSLVASMPAEKTANQVSRHYERPSFRVLKSA